MTIAYLDNAATTRLHPEVREAMEPFFRGGFGNPSSLHSVGRAARKAVEDARERIASRLKADPKEITFTSCATEANNWAILGTRTKHIVTTQVEHPSVLEACACLERQGVRVTRLPVDRRGRIDPTAVEQAITPATGLLSIMWANNEVGTLQPIAEIARKNHPPFHTDAAQALGKVPISLEGIDLLTFSAHKIHGPKGIAGLYVRTGTSLSPLLVGGGQEFERRAGTENVPLIVGLACAIDLAVNHLERNAARMEGLRKRLSSGLLSIPHSHVHGHSSERLPGILNISFEGVDGEAVILALDVAGVCVSTGSACASLGSEPSHVLRAMGLSPELTRASVRFSVAADTTDEEIEHALATVPAAVERLRRLSPVYEAK